MSVIDTRNGTIVFRGSLQQCRLVMRNMASRWVFKYLAVTDGHVLL